MPLRPRRRAVPTVALLAVDMLLISGRCCVVLAEDGGRDSEFAAGRLCDDI